MAQQDLLPISQVDPGKQGQQSSSVAGDAIWKDVSSQIGSPSAQLPNLLGQMMQMGMTQPKPLMPFLNFRQGGQGGGGGGQVADARGLPPAAAWIMEHESHGNVRDRNPSSGAFGAFQMNPSSGTLQEYAKKFGFNPYTTDFSQQYQMATAYANDRYGGWDNAQRFWQRNGWY